MAVTTSFVGGEGGAWRVVAMQTITGASLMPVPSISLAAGTAPPGQWTLRGVASNQRYTERDEADRLTAAQAGLGRPAATCAALIPITKSPAWWGLAQDERRAVFAQSHHIAIGYDYLPAVARRLFHARDLGEPFDFLTWFEFAALDVPAFDEMLARLRATPEWTYVEREVEIRLVREPDSPAAG